MARQNHLRDALYHTALSVMLAPHSEENALLPGVEARPADVLVPHLIGGRHACIDVCVVSPLQAMFVEKAGTEPGHALRQRHQQKWRKYGEACQA